MGAEVHWFEMVGGWQAVGRSLAATVWLCCEHQLPLLSIFSRGLRNVHRAVSDAGMVANLWHASEGQG